MGTNAMAGHTWSGLGWDQGVEVSQTAPVVYEGVLYATTAHYGAALDGATCKIIWRSDWKPKGHETFSEVR